MGTIAVLTVICLAANALSAETPWQSRAAETPSTESPDMDFGADDAESPAPAAPERASSPAWIYWTLGVASMAAGGTAWLLHTRREAPSANGRTEVFTDDPD